MIATLIAIPILGSLVIIQSAILSRFTLLQGSADLVMVAVIAWALQKRTNNAWQWGIIGGLSVGIVSGLPFWVSIVSYLMVIPIALLLRQRVWQVPLLAMFVATFLGTLLVHSLSLIVLRIAGTSLPIQQTLNLVTLPSIVLNLVLAIPIYYLLTDLAGWLYPSELVA